ncbi:MAG: hypothetical protein HYR85_24555 [Planctomycetes bacterium]|nr:hypothetical protein [Planctomycetota bacterium]MBI3845778.1 hypothetical protein [Planctomycetota bacterium]
MTGTARPSRSLAAAAGFAGALSGSVIVYEIALSRLFSVLVQDHLVFVVVSLAVCGLGIGGMVTAILAPRGVVDRPGYLSACAGGVGVSAIVALFVLVNVSLPLDRSTTLFLAALPPFAFAGMGLAALFRSFATHANVLYAADLAGASLGALGSILLLTHLEGAIQTIVAVAAFALAAAAVEAWRSRLRAACGGLVFLATLTVVLLVGNGRGELLAVDYSRVGLDTHLGSEIRDHGYRVVESRWDAYSRVDVVVNPASDTKRELYINAGSQANMARFSGDVAEVATLREKLEATAYALGPSDDILNLGAGGGYDALVALLCGARRLTCVEVNPTVVRTVLENGAYVGDVFRYRNVDVRIDEARSFLAHDDRRYDVIFSAMTSTLAFSDLRESTFLESYVYTTEAFGSYLDHLRPDGRLAVIINRADLADRLVLTLLRAWERRGVGAVDALRRILVLHDPLPDAGAYAFLLVATPGPIPADAIAKAVDLSRARSFKVHWAPGQDEVESEGLHRVATGALSPDSFAATYPGYRVDATTDDAPYFFQWERAPSRHLVSLLLKVGGLAIAYLFVFMATRKRLADARSAAVPAAYFTTIGIGFMLVEVTLLSMFNRFLGYPTLTLSVVLFTLLVAGGLGSLAGATLVKQDPARAGGWIALLIAALACGLACVLPGTFDRLQSMNVVARTATTLALLAPLGFCLGLPFPLGIRALRAREPGHVPWIWGWNGLASVIGSTVAVLVAMQIGLRLTLVLGAATYALLPLFARRMAPDTAPPVG